MADGGAFLNSLDGGLISDEINKLNSLNISISSSYLMDSGNLIIKSNLDDGINTSLLESGMISKFYKINVSSDKSENSFYENKQLFKILPSDSLKYKVYDELTNTIYALTGELGGATLYISGIDINNNKKTLTLNSLNALPPPTREQAILNSNYYHNYYKKIEWSSPNYEIVPSEHLLYIYNTNSQESIDIKDYYFQMRTGVTGANILGINCNLNTCISGYYISTGQYLKEIRHPIHSFLRTGNKPIKYACLFHGIPLVITGTPHNGGFGIISDPINKFFASASVAQDLSVSMSRYSGYSRSDLFPSPQYAKGELYYNISNINNSFLFNEYSGNAALFCAIGMPTGIAIASNNTQFIGLVSGYIKHICEHGLVDGIYLKGSGQNTTFLAYSNNSNFTGVYSQANGQFNRETDFYNNLGVNVYSSKPIADPIIASMTGGNVGGFTSDGWHGALYTGGTGTTPVGLIGGLWPTNNGANTKLCKLTGYCWYISSHYESNGGDEIYSINSYSHTSFSLHTRPNAFGGTNYEYIPVGFVGSIIEPNYGGIEQIQFFDAWFNGRTFIEAAYYGLNRPFYSIMGDPLLKWR